MKNYDIKNKIKKLPDSPGVYFFCHGKKVLYVGKATSLRDRARSYFSSNIVETRGPLISKMLSEANDIRFIKTDSVLEALVLEAKLIKQLQPEANVKEKDNKSFNYVVITDEDFPRVLVMRGREIEKSFKFSLEKNSSPHSSKSTDIFLLENSSCSPQSGSQGFSRKDGSNFFLIRKIFGPFPNGSQLKEAMKIVRKMFPFRDKCNQLQNKGCFNYQIGLCPGVCVGKISKEDYKKDIENVILFFESDKKKLIKNLEKQMKDFAKEKKFEEAGKIKKTIFSLNHIQDVSLIKDDVSRSNLDTLHIREGEIFRIESYDIAHLSGTNVVGVMTVIENGEIKKSEYRKFSDKKGFAFGGKTVLGNGVINDTKALSEVLTRRLAHNEWRFPNLIVVDGGVAQKNTIEKVLKESNLNIPVVSVVKDEKHKAKSILGIDYVLKKINYDQNDKYKNKLEKDILLSNAEAHRFAINFHKKLRNKFVKFR